MQRVPFAEVDARPYFDWWRERFAPEPEPFAGLRCYQRGKSNIWIGAVDIAGLATTRTDAVGVPLLRVGRRMWKPTSVAIVTFGSDSQGNVLDVDRDEARAFLGGTPLELPADDRRWADVSPVSWSFVTPAWRWAVANGAKRRFCRASPKAREFLKSTCTHRAG